MWERLLMDLEKPGWQQKMTEAGIDG